MGKGAKIVLVILRVWQIICSAIVLGILSRFLRLVNEAHAWKDGRIIYGIVTGSISIVFAIVFIAPFLYAFMGFPMDFILFVMWLVLFSLLAARTTGGSCNTPWFWDYWGYYWGRWWRTRVVVTSAADIAFTGCSYWRTVLAFSFMAMFTYLITAILGAYVVAKYWKKEKHNGRAGTTATGGQYQTSQISAPTNVVGGPTHTGGVGGTTAPATSTNATAAQQQPASYV